VRGHVALVVSGANISRNAQTAIGSIRRAIRDECCGAKTRGLYPLPQISRRWAYSRWLGANKVFTLASLRTSPYFFVSFHLTNGTSRTDLRASRLRTICLRGIGGGSVRKDRAINRNC